MIAIPSVELELALTLLLALLLALLLTRRHTARTATPRSRLRPRPHQSAREASAVVRGLAAQGTATANIAHTTRLPHDVVQMTLHLAKESEIRQKMPRAAGNSRARKN